MRVTNSRFLGWKSPTIFLETLEERHATEFFALAYANRDHIRPWMSWLTPNFSLEAALDLIRHSQTCRRLGEGYWLGVRSGRTLIGCAIYSAFSQMERTAEISYWLDTNHQGKGIALRACRTLIEYAFYSRNLEFIHIRCAAENERSRRIPISFGFSETVLQKKADLLNGEWKDIILYTLEKTAWEKRVMTSPSLPEALPIHS